MTQSNELLPCPFNAGNPVIRPSNFGYYVSVQVPCEKYEYKEIWRTIYFQKKDDCIKFWNTRSTHPQSPNRADEMKQVRDALSSAIKRLETIKETFPAISVDSDIKIYRDALATLDRLSAPVGVKNIEGLEEAVQFADTYGDWATVEGYKHFRNFCRSARAYLELQNAVSVVVPDICTSCGGDGIERCDNPDHGLLNSLSFRGANESACPCCIHDEQYRMRHWDKSTNKYVWNKCPDCSAPTPAQTEINLNALKKASYKINHYASDYLCGLEKGEIEGWNDCIDHLAAKYDFVRKV